MLTLLPSIPLILLSIELINQSINKLGTGNVEEIFSGSLETIRSLLIEKNENALDYIENNPDKTDVKIYAEQNGLKYVLDLKKDKFGIQADTLYISEDQTPFDVLSDSIYINSILSGDISNALNSEDEVFDNYRIISEDRILISGMGVDEDILSTINRIEYLTVSYGLIYMLFVEGNLGYIIAVVIVFILTFAAIFLAWRLSIGITNPVKELISGFKQVGEGDLNIEVSTGAKDEFEYLLNSFNNMVKDLKTSEQKLRQSERIAAWRDVARQISHEIKNPLTPIQLSLHRIRKKIEVSGENEKAVSECFETIDEEIESLRKIASEFSEFARMPKPSLIKCSLNEIINNTAVLYEKNERNIPIKLNLCDDNTEGMFDPEQLKRVVINLLTNSIAATPENGKEIEINNRLITENRIEARITDKGSGMDKETLDKIFDPYFTTKKDGTGLGMPIIKRIIEEHKGDITVNSKPGEGTEVKIILPLDPDNLDKEG
ncbi:ATP-binding protein, partial [candidate division KSB1 bacterium]